MRFGLRPKPWGSTRANGAAAILATTNGDDASLSIGVRGRISDWPVDASGSGDTSTVETHSVCQKISKGQDVLFALPRRSHVRGGPGWTLYCVCDGHSGVDAAHYVKDNLWTALAPMLPEKRLPDCESEGFCNFALQVRVAMVKAFLKIGERFRAAFPDNSSGTAVTVALLCGRLLTVANLGDSEAVLDIGTEAFLATVSHKIDDNESERERLHRAGMRIAALSPSLTKAAPSGTRGVGPLRAWPGGVTLARSVGDSDAGEHILACPHVFQITLPRSGARLVMGSSGLWDLINWEEAALVARRISNKNAAARIVTLAMIQNSGSIIMDTSALVVDVLPPNVGDFPKLVKQKLKRRRSKERRGLRLWGLLRRASLGSSFSNADPQCDDPQIVANIDGWMLLKAALEATLNDSCSSLMELTCFLLADGDDNAIHCDEEQFAPWAWKQGGHLGRRVLSHTGRTVQVPRFSEDSRQQPARAVSLDERRCSMVDRRTSSRATFDSARSGSYGLEHRQPAQPDSPGGSCRSRQSFGEGRRRSTGQFMPPDTDIRHNIRSTNLWGRRSSEYSVADWSQQGADFDDSIAIGGDKQRASLRPGDHWPSGLRAAQEAPSMKKHPMVRMVPYTMHPAQDRVIHSWTSTRSSFEETRTANEGRSLCSWQSMQEAGAQPGVHAGIGRCSAGSQMAPQGMSPSADSLMEAPPQGMYPARGHSLGAAQMEPARRVPFTMSPVQEEVVEIKSKNDSVALVEDSWEFRPPVHSLEMTTPRSFGSLDRKFWKPGMRTVIGMSAWP